MTNFKLTLATLMAALTVFSSSTYAQAQSSQSNRIPLHDLEAPDLQPLALIDENLANQIRVEVIPARVESYPRIRQPSEGNYYLAQADVDPLESLIKKLPADGEVRMEYTVYSHSYKQRLYYGAGSYRTYTFPAMKNVGFQGSPGQALRLLRNQLIGKAEYISLELLFPELTLKKPPMTLEEIRAENIKIAAENQKRESRREALASENIAINIRNSQNEAAQLRRKSLFERGFYLATGSVITVSAISLLHSCGILFK